MSETVVDKLVLALQLDPKGLDKGISQAQSKLATGFKGIMAKVFAPLMAGMSFAGIFDSIYNELKQMNAISKATRTNIEDVTAWSRAVNLTGGTIEGFQQTLMFLNQNLTRIAITGRSRIKPFFEALGLDAVNLAGKPVFESLSAIGKSIENMDKRKSANILRGMGFDQGTIRLLQQGEKGVKELIARQKELGVYTDKDAKAFSAMNRNFKEITSSIKTLFLPAVMLILSTSAKVVKYLTEGIQYIRKNVGALRLAVLLLAVVFRTQLLKAIVDLGKVLMANPLGMLIMGISMLVLLLEDLWVYAKGGRSAFANIWKNLGDPKEVMEKFKAAGKVISNFFSLLGKLGSGEGVGQDVKFIAIIAWALALLVAAIGAVPVAIGVAVGLIIAFWDEIRQFFSDVAESFEIAGKIVLGVFVAIFGKGGALNILFDAMLDFISDIANSMGNFLSDAANTAMSAWNGFISWLEKKWEWLKSLLPSLSSIAKKLPSLGDSVNLASSGGNVDQHKEVYDNKKVDLHFHTAESAREGVKTAGLTPYVDTGVK